MWLRPYFLFMLKQVPGLSFSVLSATLSHLRISSRAIRSLRSSAFLFVPRSLRLCQVDCATVTAENLCTYNLSHTQSCQCDSNIVKYNTIEILYLICMYMSCYNNISLNWPPLCAECIRQKHAAFTDMMSLKNPNKTRLSWVQQLFSGRNPEERHHSIMLSKSWRSGQGSLPSNFPGGVLCTGEISNPTEDKAGILPQLQKTKCLSPSK